MFESHDSKTSLQIQGEHNLLILELSDDLTTKLIDFSISTGIKFSDIVTTALDTFLDSHS